MSLCYPPRYPLAKAGLLTPLWVALLVPSVARAQATPPSLSPVTVTATRTEAAPFDLPASIDVVGDDRIQGAARPQISLSESLSMVPGVVARDRQNYAQDLQLSVRGFGARSTFGVRGVRIEVDGIPATMPDGQGQLSHIDLASVSRMEVLRGPYSALYGNSSGGVVQLFTEEGEGPAAITTSLVFGSDGLARQGLKVTGSTVAAAHPENTGNAGRLGYAISASHLATNGYRDHSAARRDLGNIRLDWTLSQGDKLTLVANSVNLRADDPLGLTRAQFEAAPRSTNRVATQFDTRKTVEQTQAGLTYQHRISADNRITWMVYAGQRETQQFQAIPVAVQTSPLHPGGVIGLSRDYAGTDLRWNLDGQLAGQPLGLVAGLAYGNLQEQRRGWQNFTGAPGNPANPATTGVQGSLRRNETNQVANIDPYLQATWKPAPRWTLNAGLRRSTVHFDSADHYIVGVNGDDSAASRYSAILPVAGALFALTPDLHLYAAGGRGFETPTLNELAYRPAGTTGLQFGLRPSRSTHWELGAKGRSGTPAAALGWNAAVFEVHTQDEIVTQTNLGGRSSFQNAGATRRRGLELSLNADRGPWHSQLAYSLLDARYRDAFATCTATPCASPNSVVPAGNRIPGTARQTVAAEIRWQPAPRGWTAGLEARYVSKVYVNDANNDAAPSFATLAANLGYTVDLGGWELRTAARLDNLLNRKFAGSVIVNEGNGRFFESGAGRTVAVSVSARHRF